MLLVVLTKAICSFRPLCAVPLVSTAWMSVGAVLPVPGLRGTGVGDSLECQGPVPAITGVSGSVVSNKY